MKLTITTLVIVEGSYIQGIFHSLEEHPGKAYQELVDQVENEYGYDADKDLTRPACSTRPATC